MPTESENSIVSEFIEVILKKPDDFLKVCETLTRMGISSFKSKSLFQSCHLLHKKGRYFIVHFKQLFMLDDKLSDISDEDLRRTKYVAWLLSNWGLVELVNPMEPVVLDGLTLTIIPHKDKDKWKLIQKYTIGHGSTGVKN